MAASSINDNIYVRHARTEDIDAIVVIHQESFIGFFLTFLGTRFLKLLYKGMLEDKGGVLIVAEEQGQVLGFVGGVESQSGFYRRLVQKRLIAFGWAASTALIRKPRIAPRLLRALRRSSDSTDAAADACILSIAVARSAEGKGIGRLLVTAFSARMRSNHILTYCLTTDRDQNERTNRFYQSLGFILASTYTTPEGRAMNEYVITLEN